MNSFNHYAPGVQEAVFGVGSGAHEFTGPAVRTG
jgi:hypothetical protein